MANVKTIAYLPDGAQGHAVLVALACEDIVMAPDALLGPVGRNKQRVDETVRAAYKDIAGRRRTVPPPLAVALVDPSVRVVRAITEVGDQIVLSERVPTLREEVQVLRVEDVGPRPLVLSGRRCREIGIAQLLVEGTADLARRLDINPGQLVLDPSVERGWKAAVVSLSGPISSDSVARVRVRLEEAITSKANFLCLRIDSAGGSPEQSLVLARWLREINPAEVKTVAYIPNQARSDAALIALACDDVVMNETAVLGGEGAATIDARQADAIEAAWQKIMQGNLKTLEALPLALVLPEYEVSRFVQQSTGRTEYFSSSTLLARKDKASWKKQQDLAPGPLLVDGFQAEAYGLTDQPVTSFSELAERYGLGDDITRIEPGWADRLLDALASPGLAWLLLLIGGVGLYIEVQTPGLGFGGFIAMVAFIIYFWSQYLNGTSGWLEVMLFLAGVICLAAEIFVVPGIGILGLGGGLLIVASLVLASQSFVLPANSYQVQQLQVSLLGILGAGVGVVAFGVVVRRWLPSTPVLRHVLLVPPERDAKTEEVTFEHLIGKTGVTVTRLAPAGKAEIENHLHDVYADDMLIESGTAVHVTAVRSGRIMVVPYSQETI
jgi:membrane-bound ClpP family serine protease